MKCRECDQEMSDPNTNSCGWEIIAIGETFYYRSPFHFNEQSGRCHDCNIAHGGTHHFGCDVERCPKCGRQLISCGCVAEDESNITFHQLPELMEDGGFTEDINAPVQAVGLPAEQVPGEGIQPYSRAWLLTCPEEYLSQLEKTTIEHMVSTHCYEEDYDPDGAKPCGLRGYLMFLFCDKTGQLRKRLMDILDYLVPAYLAGFDRGHDALALEIYNETDIEDDLHTNEDIETQ